MAISQERIAELRAMPCKDYLETAEWQATRKRILKRDNYQCHTCQATNVVLNIHHFTYERIGCEEDTDLITLCEHCHAELRRKMAELPKLSFLQKCAWGFGTATIGTIGIEGFLHTPLPAELAVLGVAFMVAKNSPALYAQLKHMLPAEVMAWLGQAPQGQSGIRAWVECLTIGRRLTHSKQDNLPTDEEVNAEIARMQAEGELFDDSFDESPTAPNMFRFSELLKTGWRPSKDQIFVGRTMEGKDIFVRATQLCHVAIAGKTGGGKGSLMRLIMVQLCYIGAQVLLLNPHYMRWVVAEEGPQFDEDWSPFEGKHPRTNKPYLDANPIDNAEFPAIDVQLERLVNGLLAERKQQGRTGGIRFKPYFIVLDEWPSIAAEKVLVKNGADRLGRLLREGRKFGIFVMVASQDFQVKTIGVESGSVRDCLLTVFYTGGDTITAHKLLHPAVPGQKPIPIPESKLGQGIIMLRCKGTNNEPVLARVPFVDNESVYLLLGPSTHPEGQKATSQAGSVSTSIPTSEIDEVATSDQPKDEGNRNSTTGGTKWERSGQPLRELSEREKLIGELFFGPRKLSPTAIVKELYPEVKGGDAYTKASAEVSDGLRAYMAATNRLG